ncbi:PCI domain-containing protein 2 [Cichlidogyrus casuarinus]|uniref:PCI domain-containing protein 2 n=1 Tax=Cichlidogyrus casuarinus TaxID=1844966 RepID=A0ABD2QB73_9PLAT
MARLTLLQFLQNVNKSIRNKNSKLLSNQLKCTDFHVFNPNLAVSKPEEHVMSLIPAPWDEVTSAHIRCIWALQQKDYDEAYACQIIVVKTYTLTSNPYSRALSRILPETKDNWLLPIVHVAAVDIRKLAHGLDSAVEDSKDAYGNRMENTAQLIMRLFQLCAIDGKSDLENSKKRGMMCLANQLFKIYFQINKLNLCKSLIRAIDNVGMEDYFSIAQRVTYRYYVGRKAMFDGDFTAANDSLSFAFEHCPAKNTHNKRLILIYLIPARMLLGIMPHNNLLLKYNLCEFLGIVEATKAGDYRRLTEELNNNESFFINCGIYLILEKLKSITYRNLFKRM